MDSMDLYFIALIPHSELRNEIRAVKDRIRLAYGAGHALKSPAHITMQMPFKRNSRDEYAITAALEKFGSEENPFTVRLDGFGCFAPKVIFIRIEDPDPVKSAHGRLKRILTGQLGFAVSEIMNDVQPHITVATRDLTKEAFREAWPEFQNEEFKGTFEVHSIFLLKHNGKNWDILKEFPFGNNG